MPAPGGRVTPRVVDGPLDPTPLVRSGGDPACGALVVLSGPAGQGRGGGSAGAGGLERSLEELEEAAASRFGVRRCGLALRRDAPPGATEAVAVVRALHRAAAFEAARWALAAARERLRGPSDTA